MELQRFERNAVAEAERAPPLLRTEVAHGGPWKTDRAQIRAGTQSRRNAKVGLVDVESIEPEPAYVGSDLRVVSHNVGGLAERTPRVTIQKRAARLVD